MSRLSGLKEIEEGWFGVGRDAISIKAQDRCSRPLASVASIGIRKSVGAD